MITAFLYENFELFNPFITLRLIVWSLFAGFVVASLLAIYNKRVVGSIVRRMLSSAASEENAKTIGELGYDYKKDIFVKSALRSNSALRKYVFIAGEKVPVDEEEKQKIAEDNIAADNSTNEGEDTEVKDVPSEQEQKDNSERNISQGIKGRGQSEKIDFETAKFYIPEEMKIRAELRYSQKGTDLVALIIGILVFAIAAAAAIWVVPKILTMLDDFITMITSW
ncbi:MAG: hypothetical protein WBI55_02405 [Eubacteriales bacterium]|jgi:hypothetical protein|nr:hypothetical protein [Clostridiales bacterium]